MLSDLRILVFGTFLKLAMHVQTSRSQRLFNGIQSSFVQNEGEVLLVSFLSSTVSCFHLRWTKTSGEVKKYDFSKYFFTMCTKSESEMMTCRTVNNGKLSHIYKSSPLEVVWLPFLLTTSNFQPKRSRLRCHRPGQENPPQEPGMRMLTGEKPLCPR